MQDLKKIGQTVAALRKQKNLSQEDLAGLAEMDRSFLSEIENGHKNFSMLVLFRLAEALGVTPEKIISGRK